MTVLFASPGNIVPGVSTPGRIARAAIIGICLSGAVFARLAFLAYPFLNDAGLYIYMGKVVATGGRLYQDFYETKFPGVALLTGACWRLFGSNWHFYVFLQLGLGLAGSLIIARDAGRFMGRGAALAVGAFTLVFLNVPQLVFGGFQLETVQCFFAIVAASAGLRGIRGGGLTWYFCAGVAAGCGAMVKPTGAAVLAALVIVTLIQGRGESWWDIVKRLAAGGAGFLLPVFGVVAWIAHAHLLGVMPALWHQITLYGSQSPFGRIGFKNLAAVAGALAAPIVLARCASQPVAGSSSVRIVARLGWLWLAFELVGVILQARMYMYHFLVLVPPAALIYGVVSRHGRLWPIAFGLVPFAAMSIAWSTTHLQRAAEGAARPAVEAYLVSHTQSGDYVWMDHMERLLVETDRRPGARYAHLFYFANYDAAPLDYSEQLLRDFEERKPKYIALYVDIDAANRVAAVRVPNYALRPVRRDNFFEGWRRFEAYLATHYLREAEVGGQIVYRPRPSR